MKKIIRLIILIVLLILFFLAFVPVIKIDTLADYWDSQTYARIAEPTEQLFKSYVATFSAEDSTEAKKVTVQIFINNHYKSVFKIAGRGYRARESRIIGLMKADDYRPLFPENPAKILLTPENYDRIIQKLNKVVQKK